MEKKRSRFVFQAEDGIRDLVRSRGLGDVYKRQAVLGVDRRERGVVARRRGAVRVPAGPRDVARRHACLLYTSDAADDLLRVDLRGRRLLKKKNNLQQSQRLSPELYSCTPI